MPERARTDITGWGVDLAPERRPGVPREKAPQVDGPAAELPRQSGRPSAFMTAGRGEPTPVFGTAVPPKGLSGAIRRFAYTIPDHRPAHWTTLLFADRVDVVESAVTDAFAGRRGRVLLALMAVSAGLLWTARGRIRTRAVF